MSNARYDNYKNVIPIQPHRSYNYDERYYLGGKFKQLGSDDEKMAYEQDFGYRCFVYPNDPSAGFAYLEITDLISQASWSEDLDSAAMTLTLDVWDPLYEGSRSLNEISKSDRITLYVRDVVSNKLKPVGYFVVWEISKGSASEPTITLTCYDELIYLLKSEDTFLFNKSTSPSKKGWTATEITNMIAEKYKIPTGYIARAEYKIPYFRVDNGSVYDTLLMAWTEEMKQTDVRYLIRMHENKLIVRAKQESSLFWEVTSSEKSKNQNLIDISFTNSLDDMYSAVRAISAKSEGGESTTSSSSAAGSSGGEYAAPDGGGWRPAIASHFDVSGESGLACPGYALSSSLQGFAELSNNWQNSSISQLDFSAMGGLSCGQKIEVEYKGKKIIIPKVDKGRGGAGKNGLARQIDLTRASWNKLIGADKQSSGLVEVRWRLAGAVQGEAVTRDDTTSAPPEKMSADVIAVHEPMAETYGYLQKVLQLDSGISKQKAEKLATNALYEASRENYDATLTTYLLPFLRAGDAIYVSDAGTGLNGRYYCSDVSHSMSTSGSRTSIGLNWLDKVPEKDMPSEAKKPPPPPGGGGGGTAPGGGASGIIPGSSDCGVAAINAGAEHIGLPYSWGGGGANGPSNGIGRGASIKGFDCSGFVQYAWYKGAGVMIPRFTDSIAALITSGFGQKIDKGNEQIGDLLLYKHDPNQSGTKYGHVGLWAGPNKTLESGGRNSGVGWTNRTDHILVVRVSKNCKGQGAVGSESKPNVTRDTGANSTQFVSASVVPSINKSHVGLTFPGMYFILIDPSIFPNNRRVLVYRDGAMNKCCVCLTLDINSPKFKRLIPMGPHLAVVPNETRRYLYKDSEGKLLNSKQNHNISLQVASLNQVKDQNLTAFGPKSQKQLEQILNHLA